MNLNRSNILKILLIVLVSIILFTVIQNYEHSGELLSSLFRIITPLIIGLCMAFILNVPVRFFETKVFTRANSANSAKNANKRGHRLWLRLQRPVSILLSILLILGILAVLLVMIIPGVKDSVMTIANELPDRAKALASSLEELLAKYNLSLDSLGEYSIDWNSLSKTLMGVVTDSSSTVINVTLDFTSGLIRTIANTVIGFVFSIYILASKEKLALQIRKIVYAVFKETTANEIFRISGLSGTIFTRFVVGQCTEALILGALCYLGMLIFRMPYAILVSSLIAVTALIPMFGAFIGTAVGALMILLVNPILAVWFVVFIIVLQQIESNLIYPKVVGNSVGLPGIWVLAAAVISGSLWGALGLLVSVPACAVLYCLAREFIYSRLKEKDVDKSLYSQTP